MIICERCKSSITEKVDEGRSCKVCGHITKAEAIEESATNCHFCGEYPAFTLISDVTVCEGESCKKNAAERGDDPVIDAIKTSVGNFNKKWGEFQDLQKKRNNGTATDEEIERYYELQTYARERWD